MNYTERMQELEKEHERIAKAIADAQAQQLRIEGAILLLREMTEAEEAAAMQEEEEPQR